ncbi:uncharacterized protein LOC122788282 isoform X4 [Protopterus annectens]|uniref:uncharacterized protein LOC122788282 isoform X4 n=1 Tax=Protopterus annectens TaxID=7888 RepID=UPI001CFA9093|nr:uncharacterized protein LOC122788282 isoform X4 [Protopterus annectens]
MAALRVFKIKTYLLFGSYSILSCTPVLSSFSLGPEKSNYVDQRELCHRVTRMEDHFLTSVKMNQMTRIENHFQKSLKVKKSSHKYSLILSVVCPVVILSIIIGIFVFKICWMRFYAKKDPGIISVEPKSIDKTMMLSTQRKEKNCSVANFYFMLCEERFNFFPVSQSSTHLSANCKGQLSELGSAEPVILTDTVSNLEYMYFFSSQYMYVAVAVTDNLKNVCCECPCVMGFKSRDGAVCVCILMCKDHMSCCKTTKLRKHQTCIV